MLLKLYADNPSQNQLQKIAEILKNGGIIIIPTDTYYAYACDMFCQSAVEKIIKLKNKDPRKIDLSVICDELSQVSEYAKMGNDAFKIMRRNLPGAFTFILKGSNQLPRLFKSKKQIGIRIPDNNIPRAIVQQLGHPIMVSSIVGDDRPATDYNHPELIHENIGNTVDAVIDGGVSTLDPSTIIDCTGEEMKIVREGKGKLQL